MYDICSGQFQVLFDRTIRVLSSAQAQFVTALPKLILAQAQPEKYHAEQGKDQATGNRLGNERNLNNPS